MYKEQLRTEMRSAINHDHNYSTKTILSSPSVDVLLNRTKYDHRMTAYMKAVPLEDTLGGLRMERHKTHAALHELEEQHEKMWSAASLVAATPRVHAQPPASRERATPGMPLSIRGERKVWNYDHTWYHREGLGPAHQRARASRRELSPAGFEPRAWREMRGGEAAESPPTAHIPTRPRRLGMHAMHSWG